MNRRIFIKHTKYIVNNTYTQNYESYFYFFFFFVFKYVKYDIPKTQEYKSKKRTVILGLDFDLVTNNQIDTPWKKKLTREISRKKSVQRGGSGTKTYTKYTKKKLYLDKCWNTYENSYKHTYTYILCMALIFVKDKKTYIYKNK